MDERCWRINHNLSDGCYSKCRANSDLKEIGSEEQGKTEIFIGGAAGVKWTAWLAGPWWPSPSRRLLVVASEPSPAAQRNKG